MTIWPRARKIVQIYREGHYEEALRGAFDLAETNPVPLALNLAADISAEQGMLAMETNPELGRPYLKAALKYYTRAAECVPNCIETAAAHGAALIGLGRLDRGKSELERGSSISDPDDPALNHAMIAPAGRTKGQRIADSRAKIFSELAFRGAVLEEKELIPVLDMLSVNVDARAVYSAAVRLSERLPCSTRAKILVTHIGLELLRYKRLEEKNRNDILLSAFRNTESLAAQFNGSLVISVYQAKYMIVLGDYNGAELVCRQALAVDSPDDPRQHAIPLGSVKGVNYADRVSHLKKQLKHILHRIAILMHDELIGMSEEQKSSFLSLRVDHILEHHSNEADICAMVQEAADHFKMYRSWTVFLCPCQIIQCSHFRTKDANALLQHLLSHAGTPEMECHPAMSRLVCEDVLQNPDPPHAIYLTQDSEECDIFCISKIDDLIGGFADMLSGGKGLSLQAVHARNSVNANAAASKFMHELTMLSEDGAYDMVLNLWAEVVKASAVDYRDVIMPVLAAIKWEDLKQMIDVKIADSKIKYPEEAVVEDEELIDDTTSPRDYKKGSSSPRTFYQATMYAHGALHRPCGKGDPIVKEKPSFALRDKKIKEDQEYDPYSDKDLHEEYMEAANNALPRHDTCTVCHFERKTTRSLVQIIHHLSSWHHSVGVECPVCSARFLTADALAFHMLCIHNQGEQAPG